MHFSSSRRLWIQWTTLIAVGVFFLPGLRLSARQSRKAHHVRRATTHHRRRHYRRRHHFYRRHHYRHVRASRERISQIQKALVKAGYLHAKPDGIWGPATRDAMSKYQKANGFTPTGLPEAKPLMKLGLGPHPLPPALDRAAAADAKAQEDNGASVASDSSPSSKSSSPSAQ